MSASSPVCRSSSPSPRSASSLPSSPPTRSDADRIFEVLWSVDPQVVRTAARIGTNPLCLGVPTAGFGRINASSSTAGGRTVQLVGRFQF